MPVYSTLKPHTRSSVFTKRMICAIIMNTPELICYYIHIGMFPTPLTDPRASNWSYLLLSGINNECIWANNKPNLDGVQYRFRWKDDMYTNGKEVLEVFQRPTSLSRKKDMKISMATVLKTLISLFSLSEWVLAFMFI